MRAAIVPPSVVPPTLVQALDAALPDEIPLFMSIGAGRQSLGVLDAVRRARPEQLAVWAAAWESSSFWESVYFDVQTRLDWLRIMWLSPVKAVEAAAGRSLRPSVVYLGDWDESPSSMESLLGLVEETLAPQQLLIDGYCRDDIQHMIDRFLHRGTSRTLDT
jgi:hypothetical protein